MGVDRISSRFAAAVAAAAVGIALVAAALPETAAAPPGPGEGETVVQVDLPPGRSSVTLVTGDVVHVDVGPDGRAAVTVDAVDDPSAFSMRSGVSGDLYVVPAVVLPDLSDTLDPELFNVSRLVREGHGVPDAEPAPLIVTYADEPVDVPGTDVDLTLPSIEGAGLTVSDEADLAEAITAPGDGLPGVERLRPDRQVQASLDVSVPQIGAPEAWDIGLDGTGVTVAVLDTGIDAGHPDLAGKVVAAEDFSGSGSTDDHFGHGTHVASIVAGTGAQSGGTYRGVAPGAGLLNGKVLDDEGFGEESWIIAGLEWATAHGASVINLSLGGGPTNGTDPMSLAIDQLSAETGVLVVAAAGNSGYGDPFTVDTPAAATSALAVGAVDDSDALAEFSGLGPRLDDYVVKPEITAPGVGIIAARASGTDLGDPAPDGYTELQGTSMATPHVAGAAAILAQLHPDWIGAQLKSALITSAAPIAGYGVFDQGGGRLEVPGALNQVVHTDTGTVSLGTFTYPHDDGESSTVAVTFTNPGDTELVLDLAVDTVTEDGDPASPDLLDVSPPTITLPPGGEQTVEVTAAPTSGSATGIYSGRLSVTSGGDPVGLPQVPIGFNVEPPLHDVTFDPRDLTGAPLDESTYATITFQSVEDDSVVQELYVGGDDLTVRVPPGIYSAHLHALAVTGASVDLLSVHQPEFVVDGPATVTLDGSTATELRAVTSEPATVRSAQVGTFRQSADGDLWTFTNLLASGWDHIKAYAAPTEPVTVGAFEFFSQWSAESNTNWYELYFPETDRIPDVLDYEVSPANTATVDASYHSDTPDRTYVSNRLVFRDWSRYTIGSVHDIHAPLRRTEVVSAGDDIVWWESLIPDNEFYLGELWGEQTTYSPGEHRTTRWLAAPRHPSVAPLDIVTTPDILYVNVASFSDADDHRGHALPGVGYAWTDQVNLRILAAGDVLADEGSDNLMVEVLPGEVTYEMQLDVRRTADWWTTSPASTTVWTFAASPAPGDPDDPHAFTPVPVLEVDYDVALDLDNTAPPGTPVEFGIRHASGESDARIVRFDAWSSVDDGTTWTPIDLTGTANGSYVGVPDTGDGRAVAVSLRISAEDSDGRTIEQDIERAYTLTAVPAPAPTPSPSPTRPPVRDLPDTGAEPGLLAALGLLTVATGGAAAIAGRSRSSRRRSTD